MLCPSKKPIFLALILVLPLIFAVPSLQAQTPPAQPKAGGTFEERLTQRKQERQVQLTDKDRKRLISQCKASQGTLRKLQRQALATSTGRTLTYRIIDAKLWIITGQLKLAEKDTFQLEKARSDLQTKIDAFAAAAAHYQQTLDDSIVINCQADAPGFKALIDTTRLYYNDMRAHSATIRSHILNEIKPVLSGYSAQLQPKANAEGEQ